ncbi:GAF domain-containing protein [Tianweitania sp. BSSL-BM11]|uniref:histidine kinase n=1 Tax=Tianweitania aestuarii TaxID=2814886 RepID=A0ABS5RTR5_9HYPH|nr:GAF domain-containing protein [Tianweitania aestuarii]
MPALDLCAQEPIRIPGGIQPHGALLLVDEADFSVLQFSANVDEVLPGLVVETAGRKILNPDGFDALCDELKAWLKRPSDTFERLISNNGIRHHVSAQRTPQGLMLEFERASATGGNEAHYARLRRFVDNADSFEGTQALAEAVAGEVRDLTSFNRVMIYRFDEQWNGTVIAEDGDGTLPSYLDLRFPATDIPAQARELYLQNRIRLIPSASYEPVPLVPPFSPVDGQPTDLGSSALRSVSPIHLEYMRNMGTAASMSISLIVDGKLWGLISCHNATPLHVTPAVRNAAEFLGRIVSQHIAGFDRISESRQRLAFKQIETELIAYVSRASSFQQGLVERPRQWLGITNALGASVITDDMVLATGTVPPSKAMRELAEWLHDQRLDGPFATDNLAAVWPGGSAVSDVASGLVAVPISSLHPSFIMWFRPEVIRTVNWGGDPKKPSVSEIDMRIHPRKSFETWKENVRDHSAPWSKAEVQSAAEFRNAVVNFVLKRAEERAELTEELKRSNKELESFSYSISHDLRAPFRHILGYAQLLEEEEEELKSISRHYLAGISNAALSAGQLVDDLLRFSQLGRASLNMSSIDMQKVAGEVRRSFDSIGEDRKIEWRIGTLPDGFGDAALVRQAIYNLADNAVKYTRDRDPAIIEIEGHEDGESTIYTVRDNGVGFDMAYGGKLFQVFQRLHHIEDFEGTGIGLALTKRIIDRHGGSIRAEGKLNEGASFSFTLPKPKKGRQQA